MIIVDAEKASKLVNLDEFIEYLETNLRNAFQRGFTPPQRLILRGNDFVWLVMPYMDYSNNLFITKIVSEYKLNPNRNLPKATGHTLVADLSSGLVIGLIDSNYITGLRTGALAALSVKYLARKDSKVLGVIGSGHEAKFITNCTLRITKNLEKIFVYSKTPQRRRTFAEEFRRLGYDAIAEDSSDAVVSKADILILATDSSLPVINGNLLKDGTHIISIGTLPDRRELDEISIKRAKFIVADFKDGVLAEAGDIIHAIQNGIINKNSIIDFNDIILGKVKIDRKYEDITIYKSVGYALLDSIACKYIIEKINKLKDVNF